MHTRSVPIGATIKYGSFVMSQGNPSMSPALHKSFHFLEFDDLLEKFTSMEIELNGCKKRTARGWK